MEKDQLKLFLINMANKHNIALNLSPLSNPYSTVMKYCTSLFILEIFSTIPNILNLYAENDYCDKPYFLTVYFPPVATYFRSVKTRLEKFPSLPLFRLTFETQPSNQANETHSPYLSFFFLAPTWLYMYCTYIAVPPVPPRQAS